MRLRQIFIMPFTFYKVCINPLLPNGCIYTPSCSAYMRQAIERRGVTKGVLLGFWRILRCNPFAKGGFDPVKINYKGKTKWLL